MKTCTISSLVCSFVVFVSPFAHGSSIGVSFLGDGNIQRWQLAPTDIAGVILQSNWNNVATLPTHNVGITGLLTDSTGTYTAVRLEYIADDAWYSDGPYSTPDDKLMKGVLKQGNGNVGETMILYFTNLSAGTYDVYVYGNVNSAPVDLDVSVGTVTNYWTEPAAFDDSIGFQLASSSDPLARAQGNYAVFPAVSPTSGAITILATYQGGGDGLGIAGLQLVTAGAFPSNNVPVSILQQPQPTLGPVNGTATFLVVAAGPGPQYQWYNNGTPIGGATASSYTTPVLHRSDDGSKFKVTVRNNVNSVTSDEVVLSVQTDGGARVATIGASFLGDTDDQNVEPWRLAPADAAGVLVQTNWNNIATTSSGNVGVSDLLRDSLGHEVAVQLAFNANDAWNSDGSTNSPNEKLMKGIFKEGLGEVGTTMTLMFTNLPAAFYDVYVYGNVNDGPVDLDVSVGPTTNYWTEPATYDDVTGFVQASSSNPGNRGAGNYVKFASVTPVSGTITVVATYQNGSDGLGIAGVQLAASAAFPTNRLPVVITGQPRPAVAAAQGTATFVVWSSGPYATYQWFRNGTAIPGATSSAYTTPSLTMSDNGAQYRVTVANKVNSVSSDIVVLTVVPADPGARIATIGVSFLGNIDTQDVEPWRLASTEVAGVVSQSNWNNLQWDNWGNIGAPAGGFVGLSGPLLNSLGQSTAVALLANCNDAWNSDGPTDTPNDKLMKGILKQGEVGSSMRLVFTNLAIAFYDVYVYGNVNGGPVDLDVSVGNQTNYWTEPAAFDDGTGFIEAAGGVPDIRGQGNYVKFLGVTPASGTITITATYRNGSDGLGIAGVQLLSSAMFPPVTDLTPTLVAAMQAGQLVVSWSSPAAFQLQSCTNLNQGAWIDESTTPIVTLGQHVVRLSPAVSARFFRLISR